MATTPINLDFLDHGVIGRLSRLQLAVRTPMLGSVTGLHRSATRGASVEFAEYRKYAPGDDIKFLDWRVFARTDKYFIREFEADTNLRCYLVVDTSGSMRYTSSPEGGTRFDYARRLAATLAHLLVHQGDSVGLTLFSEKAVDLPPRHTPSHLRQMYQLLGTTKPQGESNIVQTLHDFAERIRSRALVIVISDLFCEVPELLDAIKHVRFYNHDVALFHLLDRQEFDFDFTRPVRFVDMENGSDLITDPTVVREAYREAVNDYLATLRHGCTQFRVDYRFSYLDQSFEGALTEFLIQRIRQAKKGGALMNFAPSAISSVVLLAALLPIIIHMLNRLRYKTVHWAAMIFLLKANKAATRRAKLKQYLLLLFRALAIFFLIFAMMRPKTGGWMSGSPEVIVLVLDRSASMEAQVSLENPVSKRAHALALFAEASKRSRGSRFVLIENVQRQPLEMADAAQIASMQMGEPTDTAADIPAMMRAASDYLTKNRVASAEVWVASDLQKSNWRETSPEWRDIKSRFNTLPDTRVVVLDLSSTPATNLSLALKSAEFRPAKTDGTPVAVEKGTLALALEARSYGATGTFPLRLTRDGATSQTDLTLNSPVRREAMKIDVPKLPEGGGWGKIELPADDVLADNTIYYTYRRPIPLHAAVVSDQPAARLLAAAAAPDRTRADRTTEVVMPGRAGDLRWKDAALVIWQGPAPSEAVSKQLLAFVEGGGVLLAFPTGGEGGGGPLGISWSAAENSADPFRVISWDELDGPLARTDNGSSLPLARLEAKRRQVPGIASESRHVYAVFGDGRPFLVGQPLGAGQILACATTPDAEWSTLGEGFVLLPMVQRLLVQGGTRLAPPAVATAGEWKPGEGETWTSVETDRRHDPRWHAGVYKNNGRLIALNRPEIEDAPDTVEDAEARKLLPKMVVEKVLKVDAQQLETEIGPAMIVLTMIFMCLEMLLAMSKSLMPAKPKPKVPAPALKKEEATV